jgi:hypothetical protein
MFGCMQGCRSCSVWCLSRWPSWFRSLARSEQLRTGWRRSSTTRPERQAWWPTCRSNHLSRLTSWLCGYPECMKRTWPLLKPFYTGSQSQSHTGTNFYPAVHYPYTLSRTRRVRRQPKDLTCFQQQIGLILTEHRVVSGAYKPQRRVEFLVSNVTVLKDDVMLAALYSTVV